MRVLDIDLDFFLDKIACWVSDYGDRLNSKDYIPWNKQQVEDFLEVQCGLSKESPIPGRVVIHHNQAFDFWRELIEGGKLDFPFEITHVDAHSDTGFGVELDWLYIMGELLHFPPKDRWYPSKEAGPGNYLCYAIACRWVSKVDFVLHPEWRNDLWWMHLKDFKDGNDGKWFIQLKKYNLKDLKTNYDRLNAIPPLELEPEVPYNLISLENFKATEQYDFLVLSQSPGYTPKTANTLIPVIKKYIIEI